MILRRSLLPLLATLALADCGGPQPKPPAVLTLTMIGSADQNPDTDGKPAAGRGAHLPAHADREVRAWRRVRADRARAADTGSGRRRFTGICALARRDSDQDSSSSSPVCRPSAWRCCTATSTMRNGGRRAGRRPADRRSSPLERRQTCYHAEAHADLDAGRSRLGETDR